MKLDDFNLRGLASKLLDDADAMERVNADIAQTMRGAAYALRLAHKRLYPGIPTGSSPATPEQQSPNSEREGER